ncbi:MAG: hypothetical protein NTX49_08130 [Chlamydiae bacterium]|nr:hypothetical protein [Chlamydiota bacterium]
MQHRVEVLASTLTDAIAELFKRSNEAGYPNTQQAKEKLEEARVAIPYIIAYSTAAAATADLPTQAKSVLSLINKAADLMGIKQSESLNRAIKNLAAIPLTALATPLPSQLPNIQQATLDLESALSEAGRFLLASPTQSSPTTGATEPRATTAPKFVRGTHSNLGGRGRCADLSLAHQLLRRREGQVIRPETLTSIADNLREDVITKIRDPSFHSIENNRVRIRQDLNTIKAAGSLTSQKISSTLLAFSLNIQDLSGPIPVDIQQGLRVTLSGCRQPKKIFNIPNNQGNTDPFIALSYEIYKKIHGKEPESTLDLKKFGTNFINNSSDFKGDRLSTLRSAIQALKDRAERETSRISAILSKRVSETTTPELVAIYTDLLEYDPEAQSDETYFQALVEARSQPASEPYNIMIVDDADPSIKDRGLYQITQVIKPENSSDFNDINSQNNLFIWYDRPQGHYHSFIPAENAPSGGQRQSLPQPGSPSPSGNLVGGPRQALPPTPPSASAGAPPPQTSAHGSKLPEVTMAGTISEARRLVNETYGREGGLFGPDAKPSERKQTTAPIAPVPKAPTRDPLRVEQGSDQDPLKPQPALPPAPPSASSAFASSAAEQIGTAGPLPISPQDVASPSSSRTPGVPTPGQRPMSILEDIRQTLSDIIPDFSEEETTLLADLPGHFSKDITRIPPEAPIQENISQLRQIIEKLYPYSRELYDSQPEYKKEIERLLEGAIIVLLDEEKDGLVNHLSTPLTINHITGSRSQDTTLEFILEAVHELRAEAAAAALAALEPPPASSKSPVTSLPHPSPGSDTPTRARLPAERVQPQAGVSQSGILPVADGGSPLSPSSPPQNMPQTSAEAVPEARARLPSQERVRSASTETPHSGLETGTLGGSSPLSTGSEPRLSTEQTRADEADLQSLQRELDAEDSLEDVEREIKSSLNALTPDFNPDEFAHLKALSRPPLEMPRYTPEGFSEKIAELRNIIQKLSPYSETQHGTQEEYEEFIAKVFQKAISVYVTAKQHENKNELVNYLQLIGFKGVAELPTQIEGARLIQSTLDQLQSQQLDEGLKSSEFVPQADEEDLLTELAELTDSDKAVSSSAKPISTSPVAGTPPPTAAAKIATTASTQLPVTGSPPLSRRRDTPTQPSPLSTVPAKPVPKKEPPLPPPSVTAARARATRPAAAASSAASAASTPLELLRKEQVRVINILARPIDLHGVLREIGTTNLDLIQLTTIIPKLRDLTDAQKRQARENLQLLIVDRNAKAGLAEATIQELSSQELQKINTVRLPTSTRKLNFLMPLLYPKLPSVDEAAHADQFKAIVEAATKFLIAGKISELTGFLHTVPNLATKSLTPLERYKALGSITAMLIKRGAL